MSNPPSIPDEESPSRRTHPASIWTFRRRPRYPRALVLGGVLLLLGLSIGAVTFVVSPLFLGAYNLCPTASNAQAFRSLENYGRFRFPARLAPAENHFGAQFDIQARDRCTLYVQFDMDAGQLEPFIASTLIKTREALSAARKPAIFDQEQVGWATRAVSRFLAGEASEKDIARRTQSLLIDLGNTSRYMVYLVLRVAPE